jgi:glyoxylase-like metal-dependent hydrolase (beta-lactamase superfamily II)
VNTFWHQTSTRSCVAAVALLLVAAPAMAQEDFTGEWEARYHEDQPERIPGPELGDYLGLPINAAARLRADSWDASIQTLPEWQCRPHPADYGTRGPANLRVWKDVDPLTGRVVAYHTHVQWQAQERTIWMDGRPHPPVDAPHTWQGFSTGVWDGNTLVVTTTHLKEGYLRRNGVPRSDLATLVEHWTRHGNVLTLASMVYDPVYLTEPFLRTTNWELNPKQQIDPYPCEVGEEVSRRAGEVPSHLPGTNPFLEEFARQHHLPVRATRGGAETAMPEFMLNPNAPLAAPAFPREPGAGVPVPDALHMQHVQGKVYMLAGPSGNLTVQIGDEGLLLVDAGPAAIVGDVLAQLRTLSTSPIRYVINTGDAPEHTGGDQRLFAEGETIAGGDVTNLIGADSSRGGAVIIGHENVTRRMTDPARGGQPLPFGAYPTDTYAAPQKNLFMNGEAVRVLHMPKAHSDGDSIVFFRRSDVISTGDVFRMDTYPVIDVRQGGTIQGEIDALNGILNLAVPAAKSEGGTYIVPGRGRLCDVADVAYYRDMITIVRDRVQDMKTRGMTMEQVVAARPTRDYDGRWGSTTGAWTTDMFVQAVYQTLGR